MAMKSFFNSTNATDVRQMDPRTTACTSPSWPPRCQDQQLVHQSLDSDTRTDSSSAPCPTFGQRATAAGSGQRAIAAGSSWRGIQEEQDKHQRRLWPGTGIRRNTPHPCPACQHEPDVKTCSWHTSLWTPTLEPIGAAPLAPPSSSGRQQPAAGDSYANSSGGRVCARTAAAAPTANTIGGSTNARTVAAAPSANITGSRECARTVAAAPSANTRGACARTVAARARQRGTPCNQTRARSYANTSGGRVGARNAAAAPNANTIGGSTNARTVAAAPSANTTGSREWSRTVAGQRPRAFKLVYNRVGKITMLVWTVVLRTPSLKSS